MMTPEDYTVGWVCALAIEFIAAKVMLDEEHPPLPSRPNDKNTYFLGRIGPHNVAITCLPAGQTGTNKAASVATEMCTRFPCIRFGLMVGIGGGVPSAKADVRLGDVVVSEPHGQYGGVVQYDLGKTLTGGVFLRTGHLSPPPEVLLSAVQKLKVLHSTHLSQFSSNIAAFDQPHLQAFIRSPVNQDVLFKPANAHIGTGSCDFCNLRGQVFRQTRTSTTPVVHYGLIASGNQVMKDAITRDRLSSELGGVLCFDMEAAGLMNTFPCLVIRGISDYSDSHKNDAWHGYAAATAAAYAKDFLGMIFVSEIKESRMSTDITHEVIPHLPQIKLAVTSLEEDLSDLRHRVQSMFKSSGLDMVSSIIAPTVAELVRREFDNMSKSASPVSPVDFPGACNDDSNHIPLRVQSDFAKGTMTKTLQVRSSGQFDKRKGRTWRQLTKHFHLNLWFGVISLGVYTTLSAISATGFSIEITVAPTPSLQAKRYSMRVDHIRDRSRPSISIQLKTEVVIPYDAPVLLAIEDGDLDDVKGYLHSQPFLMLAKDQYGATILHRAVWVYNLYGDHYCHGEIVAYLMSSGVDCGEPSYDYNSGFQTLLLAKAGYCKPQVHDTRTSSQLLIECLRSSETNPLDMTTWFLVSIWLIRKPSESTDTFSSSLILTKRLFNDPKWTWHSEVPLCHKIPDLITVIYHQYYENYRFGLETGNDIRHMHHTLSTIMILMNFYLEEDLDSNPTLECRDNMACLEFPELWHCKNADSTFLYTIRYALRLAGKESLSDSLDGCMATMTDDIKENIVVQLTYLLMYNPYMPVSEDECGLSLLMYARRYCVLDIWRAALGRAGFNTELLTGAVWMTDKHKYTQEIDGKPDRDIVETLPSRSRNYAKATYNYTSDQHKRPWLWKNSKSIIWAPDRCLDQDFTVQLFTEDAPDPFSGLDMYISALFDRSQWADQESSTSEDDDTYEGILAGMLNDQLELARQLPDQLLI